MRLQLTRCKLYHTYVDISSEVTVAFVVVFITIITDTIAITIIAAKGCTGYRTIVYGRLTIVTEIDESDAFP